MKHHHLRTIAALLILLTASCSPPDDRLARFAQEATSQQAQQNRDMAHLSRAVSEDHRRVVETVEKSRQAIVVLEQDLQGQRDRLDEERKSLADERHRESLLAPVLNHLGVLLIAALPLLLCWYLLHGLRSQNDDEAVSEVLIHELTSSERWGKQEHLDKFLQAYSVEKCRLEARRKGNSLTEQALEDGSVKLTINVGS